MLAIKTRQLPSQAQKLKGSHYAAQNFYGGLFLVRNRSTQVLDFSLKKY